MSVTLDCKTAFDITPTGIKGHQRQIILPCQDATGSMIHDLPEWTRARNKQRNWETINQIVSLRTLPYNFTKVMVIDHWWQFSFDIEHASHIAWGADPVGVLRYDCKNIPMITGLDEADELGSILDPYGPNPNIVFTIKSN